MYIKRKFSLFLKGQCSQNKNGKINIKWWKYYRTLYKENVEYFLKSDKTMRKMEKVENDEIFYDIIKKSVQYFFKGSKAML